MTRSMTLRVSALTFTVLAVWLAAGQARADCGDANIETGQGEQCEFDRNGQQLAGEDCSDHGFVSGVLHCAENTCLYDVSGCSNDPGALCGNGVKEGDEDCDGGCWCSGDCLIFIPYCGNQCTEGEEECDDGGNNSDWEPNACRTDCDQASCGDGVIDAAEQCDEGSDNSDFVPDECRADCKEPSCGDGVVDVTYSEQCDLGPQNSNAMGSACTTLCLIPYCGNGVVEAGETCDDGSGISEDACTQLCRPNTCGDGFVQAGVEACDGMSCSYACAGDPSVCGNGALEAGEECDEGAGNADTAAGTCRTDCALPRCGDGVVDAGEACDLTPGCLSDCSVLPSFR